MAISMGLRILLLVGIALLANADTRQPAQPFSEEYLSLKRDLTEAFQRPLPGLSIREIIALFSLLEEFQQIVWQEEGIRGWERIGQTAPDVLQNGIFLLVDGTSPATTRKLMETRASALLQQQEVKYRMVATGIECIKKDVPPVVTEYLLASYYGGMPSHKYPDNEARPVRILKELLQRTPLSQLDFPALAEIFFDLEVIHRKEEKEALDELAVLVHNDPLLLGSFYLEMPPDQSQQMLEARMNGFLMGELESSTRRLRLANSGCPYPYLYRASTQEVEELPLDAYPLGIRADTQYESLEVKLEEGDYVVFCTDGLAEASNVSDELFGFERLGETIRQGCREKLSAAGLIDRLMGKVQAFAGESPQDDDRTCVVIRVG